MDHIKEVTMDVLLEGGGGGGGGSGSSDGTRRQRGAGRRRRTRHAGGDNSAQESVQIGGGSDVAVEKVPPGALSVSVSVKPPVPVAPVPVAVQMGGGGPAPTVVIAPPKKRPPKLLLIPGAKKPTGGLAARTAALQKTFKAHKVRVLIDNTAKTQRRRRQTLQAVEAMTEDQLRGAAVAARLSRRETVEKVPVDLLRQMLKDYRMMRGMLL